MDDKHKMKHEISSVLIATIGQYSNEIASFLMASVTGFLRAIYFNQDGNKLIDAILCGLFSLAISYAADALGVDAKLTLFISSMVGFLGVSVIRDLIIKTTHRKIRK